MQEVLKGNSIKVVRQEVLMGISYLVIIIITLIIKGKTFSIK